MVAQLAQEQSLRDEHDRKVAWFLLRIDDEGGQHHLRITFQYWHDFIEDGKTADSLSSVTAEAERLRRMHRADIRRLMGQLMSVEDVSLKHAILGCWREHTSDVRSE